MSQKKFLSVFTPSRTNPDDLEAIFVQRHALLRDAVERVEESAHTDNKHHLLFVGPRGSGKTHFTTLLVHRLGRIEGLEDKLHIAWLNEDETSTSLLELLLKIYQALSKRYPSEYQEEALDPAFDLKADEAKDYVFQQLLEHLGGRTPLIVIENLDALLFSLGDSGQKEFRAFLQEHPIFAICATAQALIDDLTQRNGPFFGFFQTEHMKALNLEEATSLLTKIAALNEQYEIEAFLRTPRGRARIRALHHLSGGNHRIYVVLSQFITRDNIEDLIVPFQKMIDELTPYYQERVRTLPPLQRKIVEYLCHCEETVPVKRIARQLFATHQTISNQLKDLRAKGYVKSAQRGRESLYEVSENLMRICVEVKENQNYQPLRLLVDFIRVWYEDSELKSRREAASCGSQVKQYLDHAYELTLSEGNLRQQILVQQVCTRISGLSDFEKEALKGAPEALPLALDSLLAGEADDCLSFLNTLPQLSEARDFFVRGKIYSSLGKIEEAIADYTAVIDLDSAPVEQVATALVNRGVRFSVLGKPEEAIADYTAVIDLDSAPVEQVAKALFNRGVRFSVLGKPEEAIADYTAVIDLDSAPVEQVATALVNRGITFSALGKSEEAIADYTAVIDLEGAPVEQVAKALFNRGVRFSVLGKPEEEIADYTAVIDLEGAPVEQVATALVNRGVRFSVLGKPEEVIADYTAVIDLEGASVEQVATALFNRGVRFSALGKPEEAIADYTAVIDLDGASVEQVATVLVNRGSTFFDLGKSEEAIADYTAVIDLDGAPVEQVATALVNRGITFSALGKSEEEIADYTAVIDLEGAPVEQVATALVNRGITFSALGKSEEEIADYTAVIDLEGAPVEQVAIALFNRGITFSALGKSEEEIADYTAVIDLEGAPVEQVATALVNRGITFSALGKSEEEIADYTAVIDLEGAPVEQVAKALFNRGVRFSVLGKPEEAIADYTAVIDLEGAPVEQVAKALVNRGVRFSALGKPEEEIADYTAVIDLDGAPVEQVATALFNRGVRFSVLGKPEEEIADYTAVIDLEGAPVEQVAKALVNRGVRFSALGKPEEEIADYTAVIDLDGAPVEQVATALFNRGVRFSVLGKPEEEIADYTALIDLDGAPVEQVATALVNRGVSYSRNHFFKESEADFLHLSKLESSSKETRVNSSLGLAELRGRQGRWSEAMTLLGVSLKESSQTDPRYVGDFEELLLILFEAGLSQVEQNKIVAAFIKLATEHDSLSELGGALTSHLSALKDKKDAALLHLFSIWKESWLNAAANNIDLEIPMRIFKTGVDYLKSQPRDESILLTLKSEERNLLRETLGLYSK